MLKVICLALIPGLSHTPWFTHSQDTEFYIINWQNHHTNNVRCFEEGLCIPKYIHEYGRNKMTFSKRHSRLSPLRDNTIASFKLFIHSYANFLSSIPWLGVRDPGLVFEFSHDVGLDLGPPFGLVP